MSTISEPPAQTGEPVAPIAPGGEDQLPAPPPSPAPADLQDLLWPRISAALIDLAVLLGPFLVLSVATGGASWDQGASFTLDGWAAILFLALVLGYYFGLEAPFGQTVGKYLLGLRVVRPDGTRPSTSAITGRTLLRIVDWLPLLYLVGFITMMATGTRRQRLGDLAARTGVGEAAPARHRGIIATLVTVVLLGVVAVAVQQAADSNQGSHVGDGTYRGHGVSFDYPAGWQEIPNFPTGGNEQWSAAVAAADMDLVVVSAYAPYGPVTAENLDTAKSDSEELVQQLAERLGGTVLAGPEEITVAGKPGLWFRMTGTRDGTPFESRLVFVFVGTTEYEINCQHTAENADEIERGCDQILRTFAVTP
jgi:uncharacterized RDD family membrane protein YckC